MKKLIAMAVVALMTLPAAAQMQEAYPSYIQVTGRAEKELSSFNSKGQLQLQYVK